MCTLLGEMVLVKTEGHRCQDKEGPYQDRPPLCPFRL